VIRTGVNGVPKLRALFLQEIKLLLPHEAAFHRPLQLPPDVSIRHQTCVPSIHAAFRLFELGDRAIGQSQFVMCATSEIFDDGIKQRLVNIQPWLVSVRVR
jgi:hypothetical protein